MFFCGEIVGRRNFLGIPSEKGYNKLDHNLKIYKHLFLYNLFVKNGYFIFEVSSSENGKKTDSEQN